MTGVRDAGGGGRCLGTSPAFVEADSPRVRCPDHGVVTAQVPWACHGAGHTYAFDDTAAWLVTHCSKSAVGELLRIAWRTVGSIVTRVTSLRRIRQRTFLAADPKCGSRVAARREFFDPLASPATLEPTDGHRRQAGGATTLAVTVPK